MRILRSRVARRYASCYMAPPWILQQDLPRGNMMNGRWESLIGLPFGSKVLIMKFVVNAVTRELPTEPHWRSERYVRFQYFNTASFRRQSRRFFKVIARHNHNRNACAPHLELLRKFWGFFVIQRVFRMISRLSFSSFRGNKEIPLTAHPKDLAMINSQNIPRWVIHPRGLFLLDRRRRRRRRHSIEFQCGRVSFKDACMHEKKSLKPNQSPLSFYFFEWKSFLNPSYPWTSAAYFKLASPLSFSLPARDARVFFRASWSELEMEYSCMEVRRGGFLHRSAILQ